MLSTKPIKNAGQARFYFYEKDNYYFKDSPDAKAHSQWVGRGAEQLKLSGEVDPGVFQSLLEGRLPNGVQLGKVVDGKIQHRPGYDLTFSAPKSVSLLGLMGGDQRLVHAHDKAVQTALRYVERTCAQARIQKNGEMHFENTDNLVFATFQHDLSRALDPQLHTHCVTMNATLRQDGKWRALASSMQATGPAIEGFWERVRYYQRYLGFLYRAELAYEVQQLGYAIQKKEKGFWEIAGIHPEDLAFFSKRRQDIENVMAERGVEGARAAAYAALYNRPKKEAIDRVELALQWKSLAKTDFAFLMAASQEKEEKEEEKEKAEPASGEHQALKAIDEKTVLPKMDKENNKENTFLKENERNEMNKRDKINEDHKNHPENENCVAPFLKSAREAVDYAIEHLSATQPIICHLDIVNVALQAALDKGVNVKLVMQAMMEAQREGKLIPLGAEQGENVFTTSRLLHYEQQTLNNLFLMKGNNPPLCDEKRIQSYLLQQDHLNSSQKSCLKQLFTARDQLVAIEGATQSGKENLYKPIEQLAKMAKHKVIVLAPTSHEAQRLQQVFQLKRVDTIAGFMRRTELASERFAHFSGRDVLALVHEAQNLSTKDLATLTTIAIKTGIKLIPVFDQKNPLSLGHGAALAQLQRNGMTTLHLKEMQAVKKIGEMKSRKEIKAMNKRKGMNEIKHLKEGESARHGEDPENKIDIKDTKAIQTIQNFRESGSLTDFIAATLPKVQDNILAVDCEEKRFEKIAQHYVDLHRKVPFETQVLMQTKAQCEKVNQLIHQQLKESNRISNECQTLSILLPRRLTPVQYAFARHYHVGQWVRFNDTYRSLQVARGDYCRVKAIRNRDNEIVLENARGTTVVWDPQKVAGSSGKIEVFDEKEREFRSGEKIIMLRTIKTKDIHSHEQFTIKKIKPQKLVVINSAGKIFSLKMNQHEYRHFDYGYAITAHSQSHLDTKTILAHQSSSSRLSSQRQFYKMLSGAQSSVFIYTDDRERYLTQLKYNTGDKIPLIDTLLSKALGFSPGEVESVLANTEDKGAVLNERLHAAITVLIAAQSETFKQRENLQNREAKCIAEEAVQYALWACAEREAAFTHKEILETALRHALGSVSPTLVEKAIRAEEKKGGLIRGQFASDGTRWTTPAALSRERFILNWAKQGEGNYLPWDIKSNCEHYLNQTALREEQKEAVGLIVTTNDRLVAIQGAPGTGKTTLLCAVAAYLKTIPVEVQYLAPTHSAVNELNREGLNAMTLQQWLANNKKMPAQTSEIPEKEKREALKEQQEQQEKQNQNQKQQAAQSALETSSRSPHSSEHPKQPNPTDSKNSKKLFILDESSFVSNAQAQEFFQSVERCEGRVVLVGDRKQNPAIEAGKPQTLLEWHGIKTVYLKDIQRQKNPTLLNAVKTAYNGAFADSFKLLDQCLIDDEQLMQKQMTKGEEKEARHQGQRFKKEEIDRKALRIQATVDEYFKHNPQECLLMTLTNRDRHTLNEVIREQRIRRGELIGNSVQTTILEPRYFTEVERSRVTSFTEGHYLRFSHSRSALGIEKGDYCPIVSIDGQQNGCFLKNKHGQIIFFSPVRYQEGRRSGIEVYELQTRELRVGDSIRWTRSNKNLGLLGGCTEKVLAVHAEEKAIELQSEEGKIRKIDLTSPHYQHWDYAYAVTVYFAQGQTKKNIVALAESRAIHLANQPNFIVMISRAVDQATIITDNKEELLKQILRNTGEKRSALEAAGEIKALENSQNNNALPSNDTIATIKEVIKAHQKNKSLPKTSFYWDAKILEEKLTHQMEFILEQVLGKPKSKTGQQYRYGSHKGSLLVTISGDRCGWWKDFQTDEGGRSLLSLIQRETGLDFKKTLDYAASLLGLQDNDKSHSLHPSFPAAKSNEISSANKPMDFDAHQKRMIKIAKSIAAGSIPAKGTVAETYLRTHRGITGDLPDTLYYNQAVYVKKYDETFPAMVIKLFDAKGRVQSVHLTLLDEETGNKAAVSDPKLKFGPVPEFIHIPLNAKQPKNSLSLSLIAEGIETALSVKSAFPHADVKTVLGKGGFKRIDPDQLSKNVVLCLDNDLKEWRDDRVITTAVDRLIKTGRTVWVAMPEAFNNQKTDFNEVLKNQGKGVIIDTIKNAVDYSSVEKRILNQLIDIEKSMQFVDRKEEGIRYVHQKINTAELLKGNHLTKAMEVVSRLDHVGDDSKRDMNRSNRHYDELDHHLHPAVIERELSRHLKSLSNREREI